MEDLLGSELLDATHLNFTVGPAETGQRLDRFLRSMTDLAGQAVSRSMLKNLIDHQKVRVNGLPSKAAYKLRPTDLVELIIPPPQPLELIPEKVDFTILHEDSEVIVIVKPPGVVVHPACGHQSGTLVHGLLYHCQDLAGINGTIRPGIVHRLDKDTSGLMVVAKNNHAQQHLVAQFKEKSVKKIYHAIVRGGPKVAEGVVREAIGRHPVHRKKMAIRQNGGRDSVTHWKVIESFAHFSLLEMQLETGRTHQIRVHMAHLGMPIAGDLIYGPKKNQPSDPVLVRQCLHASRLSFRHPASNETITFDAPLLPDMEGVLAGLRIGVEEAGS